MLNNDHSPVPSSLASDLSLTLRVARGKNEGCTRRDLVGENSDLWGDAVLKVDIPARNSAKSYMQDPRSLKVHSARANGKQKRLEASTRSKGAR